jgi:hypothetical protein
VNGLWGRWQILVFATLLMILAGYRAWEVYTHPPPVNAEP